MHVRYGTYGPILCQRAKPPRHSFPWQRETTFLLYLTCTNATFLSQVVGDEPLITWEAVGIVVLACAADFMPFPRCSHSFPCVYALRRHRLTLAPPAAGWAESCSGCAVAVARAASGSIAALACLEKTPRGNCGEGTRRVRREAAGFNSPAIHPAPQAAAAMPPASAPRQSTDSCRRKSRKTSSRTVRANARRTGHSTRHAPPFGNRASESERGCEPRRRSMAGGLATDHLVWAQLPLVGAPRGPARPGPIRSLGPRAATGAGGAPLVVVPEIKSACHPAEAGRGGKERDSTCYTSPAGTPATRRQRALRSALSAALAPDMEADAGESSQNTLPRIPKLRLSSVLSPAPLSYTSPRRHLRPLAYKANVAGEVLSKPGLRPLPPNSDPKGAGRFAGRATKREASWGTVLQTVRSEIASARIPRGDGGGIVRHVQQAVDGLERQVRLAHAQPAIVSQRQLGG